MRFTGYLNDRKAALLICFSGGLFFSGLLWLFGLESGEIALLWVCFLCLAGGVFFWDFICLRRRVSYMQKAMEALDRKYLFAEIVQAPATERERVYFALMKTALKAMTEEVSACERRGREYREFIEQWVHEIKAPLTGIELLCENHKTDVTREIRTQTEQMARSVEQVLFYARLGSVEKDYMIAEISLYTCVCEALAQNKRCLIQNGVCVHTEAVSGTVCTDPKWVQFILNQILLNSVKYQGGRPLIIDMESREQGAGVTLSIRDNGMGIKESELPRVFEKGFVGSNGRAGKNATGIGLYLCAQLCGRLGIGIEIQSEAGVYTEVLLHFPKSGFWRV